MAPTKDNSYIGQTWRAHPNIVIVLRESICRMWMVDPFVCFFITLNVDTYMISAKQIRDWSFLPLIPLRSAYIHGKYVSPLWAPLCR